MVPACGGTSTPPKAAETPQPAPGEKAATTGSAAPASTAPPTDQTRPPPADTAGPEGAIGDPKVTLVSPGKDPKAELRYAPKANQTAATTMTMELGLASKIGDQSMPAVSLPKMVAELTTHVTTVAPDGTISYDFEVKSAKAFRGKDVKPEVLKKVDAEFGKIAGLKGHATVTGRGMTRELQMDVPAASDPSVQQMVDSLRQSLRQMSNPLPEEPVGIGAKWDAEQAYRMQGMQFKQVSHSTLAARKGNKVTVQVEIEQSAEPQAIQLPNIPPGAQAKLVSLSSHGNGKLQTDLTRLTPFKSDMALISKIEIEASQGTQTNRLVTDVTMKMEMKSP